VRRILSSFLVACLFSLPVLAQNPPIRFSSDKPQIAYHLFSTWADNYQTEATRGKVIGSTILYSIGALGTAGSIVTWTKGDEIAREITGSPIDPELRNGLTLGLGIGAGVSFLSGILVSVTPIKDYRAIYADVFQENDAEVQEAMAASVLHYQADRGKERRITSFVSGLIVPLIAGGITASINAAQGRNWTDGMFDSIKGSSWSMAWSITSLFSKTEEERLYDRYISARDAYYAGTK
jgi:energy-converting hydrogenase Eha subunit A